jgi:hypothetical protein
LTSPPGSPHKSAVQDIKHKHQPSQSSTSSRPLSPANASAPQYHASSSPPRRSNSSATADVDTGKIPKTWTRNSIRIPVRTRYAILIPGTPRRSALLTFPKQQYTRQQRHHQVYQHRQDFTLHARSCKAT